MVRQNRQKVVRRSGFSTFRQNAFYIFAGKIKPLLTMQLFLFILAVIFCAAFLALLEIQVEGASGWAENLDFLWFAFNPAFGLRKFRKEHIWWHAGSWWIFMPKLYWLLLPAGVILYFLSLR